MNPISRRFLIILCLALCVPARADNASSLEGRLDNLTEYFFENGRVRHYRYDLSLTEISHLSDRLLTVAEGRLRAEAMMINAPWAIGSNYTQSVRNDEAFEAEGRQLYLDYLSSFMRVKAGLQLVDWVESLTPFASDILTPYDLRWGGQGPTESILIPIWAVSANHKFLYGNLEWMAVFLPRSSRFSVGDNGYGYFPYLAQSVGPANAVISSQPIPQTFNETEFGVRYLADFGGVDVTLLGFYGHQRTPSLLMQQLDPITIALTQVFPRVMTLGTQLAYAQDAWVVRLFGFIEPNRTPRVIGDLSDPTEHRIRVGTGFDYTASRAFKLYSELLGTFTQAPAVASGPFAGMTVETSRDAIFSFRMTNESLSHFMFVLGGSVTGPEFSYLINPEVVYTASRNTKLTFGLRAVVSNSSKSDFESLKHTSAGYFMLEYLFPMR